MAYPYLLEETFGNGSHGFTSETDTESKLAIRHYTDLTRRLPYPDAIPFQGAYAAHIDLSLGDADAYLEDTTGFDLASDGEYFVRFYLYVASNLVMADDDRLTLLALQSAGPVNEVSVGLIQTAGVVSIWASETATEAVALVTTPLVFNQWHSIEVGVVLDNAGNNDGTLTLFVDGVQVGATIATLDQAALTQGRWGVMDIDATTTAGHILLDNLIVDNAQLHPVVRRYDAVVTLTKTGHACVGLGALDVVQLTAGAGTDCSVRLFDTDRALTGDAQNGIGGALNAGVANETVDFHFPYCGGTFEHGVYAVLAGTTPQVTLYFRERLMDSDSVKSYALRQR